MSGSVIFNVGGKRYETTMSTLNSSIFQDSLLHMLVRNHTKQTEIFIDRDHKFFRWILHAHRTGMIESPKVIGVSKRFWEEELVFYGLVTKDEAENKRKRKRYSDNPEEQALIDRYYIHKDEVDKNRKIAEETKNKITQERRKSYIKLFNSVIHHGPILLVQAHKGFRRIDQKARTVDGEVYDIEKLKAFKDEIIEYANELGYRIVIDISSTQDSAFFLYPANHMEKTNDLKQIAEIKMFYLA